MTADVSVASAERLGRLGYGAAPIGNLYREVSDDATHAALEAAWDGGIRYFDTAPHYGLGLSERRLGDFLATRSRDEFVVSTKVGRVLDPNPAFAGGRDLDDGFDVPDELVRRFDPSEDGVRRSIDESLERLGLDRIDIAFLHDPDVYDLDRGLDEGLPALEKLRSEGIVGAIGVGTNSAEAAVRAVLAGDLDVVMIAGRYTLLEQPALDRLLPLCEQLGVGVIAAAVFNSGLLATDELAANARYDYGDVPPEVLAHAMRLYDVCRAEGVSLPAAALQYPLQHPAVRSVVVGSARERDMVENLSRMHAAIPDSLWARLRDEGLIP